MLVPLGGAPQRSTPYRVVIRSLSACALFVRNYNGCSINNWISRRFFDACSEAKCVKRAFVVL